MANKRARRELIRILVETRDEQVSMAAPPDAETQHELAQHRIRAGNAAGAMTCASRRGLLER